MSYTVRYNQPTRAEREQAALVDAVFWLDDKLARVQAAIIEVFSMAEKSTYALRWAYMALEFAGLRGLPARMIIKDLLEGGQISFKPQAAKPRQNQRPS